MVMLPFCCVDVHIACYSYLATPLIFQWFGPLIDFTSVLFAAYSVGLVLLIFLFNLV